MNIIELLDKLPLWGILVTSTAIIYFSTEFGFLLGKRARERATGKRRIQTATVVAATMGLLAFVLAFTFGTVTSRNNELKHLVLDDVNAIGTTWLRADLLPETDRAEVRKILHDYVTLRIDSVQGATPQKIEHAIKRSSELQNELWSRAVAIARQNPTPISSLFLQSLNDMIDLHQKRVTVAIYHRLPSIFWLVLYGLTILAMVAGGYDVGLVGGRRSITTLLVVTLAFSVVLYLVVALDRPRTQLKTISQAALIDLQQDIRRSMQ